MFFLSVSCGLMIKILFPVFIAKEIIITYGLKPFDICKKNYLLWNYLKKIYVFTFIFSHIIIGNLIFNKIKIKNNEKNQLNKFKNNNDLYLCIGYDEEKKQEIYLPQKGLYQNFLITGTIGSGKTSSAMYPFTRATN